jgi:hypothetical protein
MSDAGSEQDIITLSAPTLLRTGRLAQKHVSAGSSVPGVSSSTIDLGLRDDVFGKAKDLFSTIMELGGSAFTRQADIRRCN